MVRTKRKGEQKQNNYDQMDESTIGLEYFYLINDMHKVIYLFRFLPII